MINKIIMKGQGLPDSIGLGDGQVMEEVMIPGSKVGLVIGKGGENIKMLQVCILQGFYTSKRLRASHVFILAAHIPCNPLACKCNFHYLLFRSGPV